MFHWLLRLRAECRLHGVVCTVEIINMFLECSPCLPLPIADYRVSLENWVPGPICF